ncbi:MAG: methionyl-tRNA formyltransferase [bacterium]
MRIVFMGTPEFARRSLEALIGAGFEVALVVTQPDRPAGRGRAPSAPPVGKYAREKGLAVIQPEKPALALEDLAAAEPDCIVVVAYGHILPGRVLEIPRLGCVNLHASLLPAYRGAAPIQWAIIRGETVTGVTTILMDEGMDTGPVLMRREAHISPEDTAGTLGDRLAAAGASLLADTAAGLRDGVITPEPQDHSKATYCAPLRKEDGHIDWRRSAAEIANLARGCDPWPSAFTFHRGKMLKIWKAEPRGDTREGVPPGAVVEAGPGGVLVAAGAGTVLIREVQLEGRRRMTVEPFLRGYRLTAGERLTASKNSGRNYRRER